MTGTIPLQWRLIVAVVIVQLAFTFVVLNPTLGFDDANITMNYAQNLAEGHGYVYYIGGERVEGSTSPLWTAITTLGYLSPIPIRAWLMGIGGLVALGVTALTLTLAQRLASVAGQTGQHAQWAAAGALLCLPPFFAWQAWSFMDAGLWILLVAAYLVAGIAVLEGRGRAGWFVGLASLVVVARPEGALVAIVVPLLFLIIGRAMNSGTGADHRPSMGRVAGMAIAVAGVTLAALLALRYSYFGQLQPNTFYAKVSTSYAEQALQGLAYLGSFFEKPANVALVALAAWAVTVVARSGRPAVALWSILAVFVIGGAMVYVTLGGDHFGSHRFFAVLLPPMIAMASVLVADMAIRWAHQPLRRGLGLGVAACLFAVAWVDFARYKGVMVYELRLADRGRDLGTRLNALPGLPSIAVIPAGGIALTYEGAIYDMMGLNWTTMAHAGRSHHGLPKNHGGFNAEVLYATKPELVDPILMDCDRDFYLSGEWRNMLLHNVFVEEAFQEIYAFACHDGAAFYIRRDFAEINGIDLAHY